MYCETSNTGDNVTGARADPNVGAAESRQALGGGVDYCPCLVNNARAARMDTGRERL